MLGSRRRKRKLFVWPKRTRPDGQRVKRKIIKINRREYAVYKLGHATVVYRGKIEVFNSVRDKITFEEWKEKTKRII